ncbi:sensor histidine kinase [Desulfovirgula thermocuniculi]|uniref:sensor histidine kinase n=1 Tax=Desulfovirgula thermocuniculi TaxID=348842 RepID=UPI0004052367|nr:ATP-binding protein [Desulfovirgula thermocuniculi]
MFRSIFQRLLITYTVILLAVVLVMALSLTAFFHSYVLAQKGGQLVQAAREMEELALLYRQGKVGRGELQAAADLLGQATGSRVYLLLGEKAAALESLQGEKLGGAEKELLEDIKRILGGEVLVKRKVFFHPLNMYVVMAGLPVRAEGGIAGVVLLFSPLRELQEALAQVYRIIWLTALALLFPAAAVVFLVSRHIARPVERIQRAATALAEGNFGEDLPVLGRDELAQLTATFNYMKNRLKQVEEMRREFLAAVSHELRTPLTSVRGFIQAILEGLVAPAERDKYLRRAYGEADRLARLVNDLLELARLRAGGVKLHRERVGMKELVAEVLEECALFAGQKGVSLHAEVPAGEIVAPVDRDKMKQVLLNLVDNAVKYAPGGGNVWVSLRQEGCLLEVRVRDDGPGIPEEELPFIFEKFRRAERAGGEKVGGTGLGLAIARELVALHGGEIRAANLPGRGAEVIFTVPLDKG